MRSLVYERGAQAVMATRCVQTGGGGETGMCFEQTLEVCYHSMCADSPVVPARCYLKAMKIGHSALQTGEFLPLDGRKSPVVQGTARRISGQVRRQRIQCLA